MQPSGAKASSTHGRSLVVTRPSTTHLPAGTNRYLHMLGDTLSTAAVIAGGAGIVLYLALWAWSATERPRWAIVLLLLGKELLLPTILPHINAGSGSIAARGCS